MGTDITFEGFEPSQELMTYAKEVVWRAERKAPSRSTITATLRQKESKAYYGELSVSSIGGNFVAESEADTPRKALDQLYLKLRDDLLAWKKGRMDFV